MGPMAGVGYLGSIIPAFALVEELLPKLPDYLGFFSNLFLVCHSLQDLPRRVGLWHVMQYQKK